MIVQTAPPGEPHLVILQTDHARMSGQFAEAFGNDEFMEPYPREPLLFVAAHHDDGWLPIDALVEQDPRTGLPWHLTDTPFEYGIRTNVGSPEVNEYYHPYSGILSSMHTTGFYNARFGLLDRVTIKVVAPEHRAEVDAMLANEEARRLRLKEQMAGTPLQLACEERVIFQNYKLLQFFDLLALYFNLHHEEARGGQRFPHVPRDVDEDAEVTIRRLDSGAYGLWPYPFRKPGMEFSYTARPMVPQPPGTDLQALFAATEPVTMPVRFYPVPGR